jgi:cell fate regulator YaaT (PSP1 superfamily)
MNGNGLDYMENLKELEKLEDRDIEIKKKEKKDHKIESDDVFYRIKLTYNNYSKVCRTKIDNIKKGYFLIVPTQYGPEIGVVQGKITDMDDVLSQDEILNVIRIATKQDREKYRENLHKSKEAYDISLKKIKEHNLEMKLINVHYFMEDSKMLFNFTADGRIDFRELVKDLASIFKTRIELRQIGVRDECRIIGGYGHCGRHFCCSNVSNELNPITIKMAKEQNVTLNSLKISGVCGRLLCCLSYEFETYIKEKENFPLQGAKIKVNNDWYVVVEVNIQTHMVKLIKPETESYMYVKLESIDYNKSKNMGVLLQSEENKE